ncbi:MAG: hypothetical protein PHO20_02210 [Candidatus Peribacteraceae bacterium]|nr:hypothetical protein [Candidatus Peribacteraceae bacterium]
MQQTCRHCQSLFEVTNDDLVFYDRVSPVFAGKKELIPPPTLCPDCRQQRRLTYRNELRLYRRKCSKCNEEIVAMFSDTAPYKVYCHHCWWDTSFDARNFGKEWDKKRSFSEQFAALIKHTPLPHLVIGDAENSDFTNYSWQNRNCYILSSSDYNEDCYYSTYLFRSRSCVDCTFVDDSELLYQCVDSKKCYDSQFLQQCQNCSDCMYCYDCHSCQNCSGCVGQRNKKYCLFNEQLTEEEYEERKNALSPAILERNFEKLKLQFPHRFAELEQCEHSTGNHLQSCKNAERCFDLVEAIDCRYCALGFKLKDCMDCTGTTGCELLYQSVASPENYSMQFSSVIWPKSSFLQYCLFSRASQRCFGCVSLHKNEYCILNKQYTKEEYEKLVPEIIAKMRAEGEWGEFFPVSMSPFVYNETVAQEYFPMTKEEVLRRGWQWRDQKDEMPKVSKIIAAEKLPDDIANVPDNILIWAIECEATKRPFKIVKQELDFYRKMKLPIPHFHPDERHKRRMMLRNPRKLWSRNCAKCQKPIATSYPPERPEIVFCEACYLATVY